jgi:dihydrofolate reductase
MKAIVAMSLNRVIGNQGKIPWHIPHDLKFFKKMTGGPNGGYLLMGRKTFDSVGVLPKRFTYILTKNPSLVGFTNGKFAYITENNFEECTTKIQKRLWVAGGAEIYERFIYLCDEVYATIVLDEYEGDAYMVEFEDQFPHQEIIKETNQYWIVRYCK